MSLKSVLKFGRKFKFPRKPPVAYHVTFVSFSSAMSTFSDDQISDEHVAQVRMIKLYPRVFVGYFI